VIVDEPAPELKQTAPHPVDRGEPSCRNGCNQTAETQAVRRQRVRRPGLRWPRYRTGSTPSSESIPSDRQRRRLRSCPPRHDTRPFATTASSPCCRATSSQVEPNDGEDHGAVVNAGMKTGLRHRRAADVSRDLRHDGPRRRSSVIGSTDVAQLDTSAGHRDCRDPAGPCSGAAHCWLLHGVMARRCDAPHTGRREEPLPQPSIASWAHSTKPVRVEAKPHARDHSGLSVEDSVRRAPDRRTGWDRNCCCR
jgi:hypothetical protein